MNDSIWEELSFILNKFGKEEPNEHIKIKHACTRMLDNNDYMNTIKLSLDSIFKIQNFDNSDFSRLLLAIIEVNKKVSYYKELSENRMKYVIYAVLYSYLINNQHDFVNLEGITKIRISYFNSIELALLVPQTMKIAKETCLSCIGRIANINCIRTNNLFIE